jgi:hypothetical protein
MIVGGMYLLAAGMIASAWWAMQEFSIPAMALLILCATLFRMAHSSQRELRTGTPAATPSRVGKAAWLGKYTLTELRNRPISTSTAMVGTYFGVTAVPLGLLELQAGGQASTIVIQLFIAALSIPLYGAASTVLEGG